jgi:DNA-directed RNA polymerase sigma subunit (sigma70/sigma32)
MTAVEQQIEEALRQLTAREERVVRRQFGLGNSPEAAGRERHTIAPAVRRRIIARAFRKLRAAAAVADAATPKLGSTRAAVRLTRKGV